jgi:hypothetical protein
MKTTCGHCHKDFNLGDNHDCTPECIHCGKTYSDLESPEYDSAKIAVSRHQRECGERPASWDEPIRDPEAEFREDRRERKRQEQFEERLRRNRLAGQ